MMWEIGVEGDKFRPHMSTPACEEKGCIPLTYEEYLQIKVGRYEPKTCQACSVSISETSDYLTLKGNGSKPYYNYYFCNFECLRRHVSSVISR